MQEKVVVPAVKRDGKIALLVNAVGCDVEEASANLECIELDDQDAQSVVFLQATLNVTDFDPLAKPQPI